MWADLPISYCVFSQAVTWINEGTSRVSLHSVQWNRAWWAWWEHSEEHRGRGREGHPRHQMTKVSLDTLKIILSTSRFYYAPLALAHVFFLLLLSDLLHKGTHIWHQSALAKTPSHWHYVKSKGCRSIFFLLCTNSKVRPPINQM